MVCGRRGLFLAVLTGAFAQAGVPAAQEQPSPPRLPPVLVTAPAPLPETLPRPSIPGLLDILSPDEIRAPSPRVLPDALERLPGVTLQNEQGNPYQPNLMLRGFFASPITGQPQGISVFLDGVRLNERPVSGVAFVYPPPV
jgi:iron complex outermembrane recepter protein